MATQPTPPNEQTEVAWRGFASGNWKKRVDVRDFIQSNYTPYEGDGSFLQGPTERTTGMWRTLQPLLDEEREKGVLDVSQIPSGRSSRTRRATSTRTTRSSSDCRPTRR